VAFRGEDVIEIGSTRVGQKYVLGAQVPLNNPNWKGPWDCAEFTSWCAYQAYQIIFGAGNTTNVSKAEPYSGSWATDAKKRGTVISWKEALKIPGAALIRAPSGKIGHVAFSMGDNDRTLEARGAAYGVGIFKGAAKRAWGMGCLLPGVEYTSGKKGLVVTPAAVAPTPFADEYLWLKAPKFKDARVVAVQSALRAKGIDPGPIDGELGPMTNAAIVTFQIVKGLAVDGVVGEETAAALTLAFPIVPAPKHKNAFAEAASPQGPSPVKITSAPAGFDGVVDITQSGKTFRAKTTSGFSFIVGTTTSFTDDMHRVGLYQGAAAIQDSLQFGVYKASDFSGAFGQWAHFIEPTLSAEGGARFATLNTYDRAAFTFGAPQLAAHTPDENFVVLLRQLLALPDADKHFPELSLRAKGSGKTIHLAKDGKFENLEEAIVVVRPNGKKEKQLPKLMAYLNASSTSIDKAELSASARLINWLRLDPTSKELQIAVFITQAKDKLAKAKDKIPKFSGDDWRIALWVLDILHQGRGTYAEMAAAITKADPEAALKRIGWRKYKTRIETVAAAVGKLAKSNVMKGFKV
jgi:hypothetical protein